MDIICLSHITSCKLSWFCSPSQSSQLLFLEWFGVIRIFPQIWHRLVKELAAGQRLAAGLVPGGGERPSASGFSPQKTTPGTRLINLDPSPYHPNVVQRCLGWRRMSNPSELGWIWYVRLRFWSQFGIGRSRFTYNVVRRVGLEPLFIPTFHTLGWDVSEQKRF